MPTTSYSSARLSQFSRRATRAAAAAAAAVEESQQRKEEENGGGIMRPHQDPKKMSNGPMKKEKVVRYRECRKNHAASVGGYAVDGCLEFMAAGEEGTSAALRCAACSCHRSFHKREVEREVLCDCSSNSTSPRS